MRERDSLNGNMKLLEDEVKAKTQQLITLNNHITTTTSNFEMRLSNESNSNKDFRTKIQLLQVLLSLSLSSSSSQSLQDKISTQNSQIEDYSKRVHDLEESGSLLSINSKKEIDNLKKIGDTYKVIIILLLLYLLL